jgi:hypothetical protein
VLLDNFADLLVLLFSLGFCGEQTVLKIQRQIKYPKAMTVGGNVRLFFDSQTVFR